MTSQKKRMKKKEHQKQGNKQRNKTIRITKIIEKKPQNNG